MAKWYVLTGGYFVMAGPFRVHVPVSGPHGTRREANVALREYQAAHPRTRSARVAKQSATLGPFNSKGQANRELRRHGGVVETRAA